MKIHLRYTWSSVDERVKQYWRWVEKMCVVNLKWNLKSNYNLVNSLIPTWSGILKILFSEGRMKFLELQILGSSLFEFFPVLWRVRIIVQKSLRNNLSSEAKPPARCRRKFFKNCEAISHFVMWIFEHFDVVIFSLYCFLRSILFLRYK